MSDHKTLLICTVGGSPEPIVVAIRHWQPLRVLFVHTPQSKVDVNEKVLSQTREAGFELDEGRFDLFELPDGQDLESCLDRLRQLAPVVTSWVARGPDFQVVVDFTGGTKCMSAAIGIQASHWPCVFSYVGGSVRTKEGLGVVVSGSEKVVQRSNPWDALGHQAIQDFKVLFDQRAFLAAANVAAVTLKRVSNPDRKAELACLENLAKALDAWDRFDHKTSKNLLANVERSANNLRAVLGADRGDRVIARVGELAAHLALIEAAAPPSTEHVLDLLANAKRRKEEGRYDDAVARLYRAIEAIAQVKLGQAHGFESTDKVALDRVPPSLSSTWAAMAKDGVVKLGLQDAYALLAALDDPTGKQFQAAGMNTEKSPLVARNHSILAHGFERVSVAVFDRLWSAALALANIDEARLPSFPQLAANGSNA